MMRSWRKLHEGIRSSDRVALVGSEARWLYVLLISAQDDAGRYPWSPAKKRLLVSASSGWDMTTVTALCEELVEAGLVSLENNWITVTNGAQMNGIPGNARGVAMLYPEPNCESHATRSESHAVRKRREEERREEKTLNPPTPLDSELNEQDAETKLENSDARHEQGDLRTKSDDRTPLFKRLGGFKNGFRLG